MWSSGFSECILLSIALLTWIHLLSCPASSSTAVWSILHVFLLVLCNYFQQLPLLFPTICPFIGTRCEYNFDEYFNEPIFIQFIQLVYYVIFWKFQLGDNAESHAPSWAVISARTLPLQIQFERMHPLMLSSILKYSSHLHFLEISWWMGQ